MRFLLRVRCWEYPQHPECRLRGKIDSNGVVAAFLEERLNMGLNFVLSAEGFVIYRVRVRHGGWKRLVPKGIVYGNPTNQGVTQLKSNATSDQSQRSVQEGNLVALKFSTLTGSMGFGIIYLLYFLT
ncbi:hypothetical protein OROGR_019784 [Orobanche gracilis]